MLSQEMLKAKSQIPIFAGGGSEVGDQLLMLSQEMLKAKIPNSHFCRCGRGKGL